MKKIVLAIIFLTLTFSNVCANETIELAIGEWAPYTSEKDTNGKLAEALVTEAFKLENIDVVYKYFPWKRSFEGTKKGNYAGTFPWYGTDERKSDFYLVKEPVITAKTVFFHMKDVDFKWDTYEDLKKYKVGGTLGYSDTTLLQKNGINVDVAPNEKSNYKKLLAGRIDIVPSTMIVGYNIINNMFTPAKAALFTNHPKALINADMFMLISKKIPNGHELADKFGKGLKKLKESGRYDQITTDFLSK